VDDARAWIAALPDAIGRQRALLGRLLDAVEADERLRAFRIGGSVARGTADEHSDLDTRAWIDDAAYDAALADLPALVRSAGDALDVLFETPGSPYLFVQYRDGVQLELSTERASAATGRPPGWVVLVDRDGLLEPERESFDAGNAGLWQGLAWMKLSDADKFLRRGSLWEALTALEEARSRLLRHVAAADRLRDPEYGITSILDYGGSVPAGLELTVAHLDEAELRSAALACAELLSTYGRRPFADDVLRRLATP
jgi:hypothetical protein